jgi:hypothetical protein
VHRVSIPEKYRKILKEEAYHYSKARNMPDDHPAKADIIKLWEVEITKQKHALDWDFSQRY